MSDEQFHIILSQMAVWTSVMSNKIWPTFFGLFWAVMAIIDCIHK